MNQLEKIKKWLNKIKNNIKESIKKNCKINKIKIKREINKRKLTKGKVNQLK